MRDRSALVTLDQDLTRRPRVQVLKKEYSNATVGEPFSVRHDLGVTPSMAIALPYTDCRVWSEENDRNVWSSTTVQLRCSVALAPMDVAVIE